MPQIIVKIDSFEGPFELLYHLIEKNQMDIYDIPIASLTEQYLDYLDSMSHRNLEDISEFLVMAATLLEIKSKMLLPAQITEEEEEDPRQSLVDMLVEYKRFKEISETLRKNEEKAGYKLFKDRDSKTLLALKPAMEADMDILLEDVTLEIIKNVFADIIRRRELSTDKVRAGFSKVHKDLFSVEQKMDYIKDLLSVKRKITFSKIFKENVSREEMVVTFWAVLELIKLNKVSIAQESNFSDIVIMEGTTEV